MTSTAVVTGGGKGLGREISAALMRAGYRVVISGRDKTALAEAARTLDPSGERVVAVPCDITDADAVTELADAALARLGRIDVLVNNSGVAGPTAALWETTPAQWLDTVQTNVYGTFLCCRAMLPAMIAQQAGSIHDRLDDRQAAPVRPHQLRSEQNGPDWAHPHPRH